MMCLEVPTKTTPSCTDRNLDVGAPTTPEPKESCSLPRPQTRVKLFVR